MLTSNASRARDVDAPSHRSASAGYAEGYGNQVAAIDPFGFAQGGLSIVRGKALGSRARCPQLAVKQTIRRLEFTFFLGTSLRDLRIRIVGRIFSQKTPMYFGRPARSGHGEADAIDCPD